MGHRFAPPLEHSSQDFQFGCDPFGCIGGSYISMPNFLNKFKEPRKLNPEVLKSKHLGLRNACSNLNHAWSVVRSWFCKREHESIWEIHDPICGCETPIKLFKEGIFLHITPSVFSSFQWDFQNSKVADNRVKCEDVIDMPSWPVSVT